MYTFDDRGGRSLTLRPEGTAGVLRAVVERGLFRGQLPVKVWYAGPNFRYEQPQSGRYRQHTQVGVEAVGSDDPALDAEVIWMATESLRRLGVSRARLLLNSLGCRECRPIYRDLLQEFLRGLDLDDDTRRRADINPLRVLDDKRPRRPGPAQRCAVDHRPPLRCLQGVPRRSPCLPDRSCGDVGGDPRLVRGLDYYVRTTFEFVHDDLGAQSAIGGGGRYDGLLATIGGPTWAAWVSARARPHRASPYDAEGLTVADPSRCDVYVVALGAAARSATVTCCVTCAQAVSAATPPTAARA